jgi:DNA-binding NtrC family response regulator
VCPTTLEDEMGRKSKKKVLVVEDNPNMSGLLADMLEVFEVESVSASDGLEALGLINDRDFGMVISDLRMPNMTGTELLLAVKEKYPKMPVVLISGYSIDSADDETVSLRADGFLSKPFKMNELQEVLNQFM